MFEATREQLADAPSSLPDDAARIDLIRELEELASAVAATQAQVTADFVRSQRAVQAAAGVPAERVGRGIAGQVALARRVSPAHAARYAGWSTILTTELPQTFAALRAGRTSERRALTVARETLFLSRDDRAEVDRALGDRLEHLGDRRTEAEARRLAYRLDPAGSVERIRAAAADRRVSVRPAPDAMCRLTATLPVAQGVACYAALTKAADTRTAAGDPRGRGALMADTLVERVTGQSRADDVPVEITLVMPSETLLDPDDSTPAHLDGYGPVPAPLARDFALDGPAPRWLRRLFVTPATGELVALESRRRLFTAGQRRFLRLRDQMCRTPWCEAPIRHADHLVPAEAGGATTTGNGAGLCAACNHAKQAPGWTCRPVRGPVRDGPHRVDVTTPTGHRYRSEPPDAVRRPEPCRDETERRIRTLQRVGRLGRFGRQAA